MFQIGHMCAPLQRPNSLAAANPQDSSTLPSAIAPGILCTFSHYKIMSNVWLQVLVMERLVAGLTRQLLMQRVLSDPQTRIEFAAECPQLAEAIATQRELSGLNKLSFRQRQRTRAGAKQGFAAGSEQAHPALIEYLAAQRSAWKEMAASKLLLRQRRKKFKQACFAFTCEVLAAT